MKTKRLFHHSFWTATLVVAFTLVLRTGSVLGQTLFLTINDPNPQSDAYFGNSLAGIGDIDGDLVPDIAVGAPHQDVAGNSCQGQAFVFSGAAGSVLLTLDDPNPQSMAHLGCSLAGIGDVDGDLVPDIAVGAYGREVGANSYQGQAFVFSGANGSVLLTLDDPNPQSYEYVGWSLAGIGDIDGDLVPDIAVGACGRDVAGNSNQGQAVVFSGADGSVLLTLDDPNPQSHAGFGWSLAGIGDIDGDLVPDIAVGALYQDVGGYIRQGQAFVFSGADGSVLLTLDDPNPQSVALFGHSLAGIGDVDGDLLPDIAVGALYQDVGGYIRQGQAFVFSGADGSVLLTLDDPNPQSVALFGHSLAGIGDVDGDLLPDIVVGAYGQDVVGNSNQGQAFVFSGADGSVLLTLDDPNPQSSALFGFSLAGIGDVDGDLVPDIALGAPHQNAAGNSNQGQAFVFLGSFDDVRRTTGGGFILLNADSTRPAEMPRDKANLGFTVHIDKNQAAGNLEFHDKTAGINLKSQTMTWYTVSNNKAMFQGEATINGDGLFTFRVDAKDGGLTGNELDAFDIRIWEGTDTEVDLYYRAKNDLAGGNIVIHRK
ncbi:MAG: integrin alpha [Thermodesulfobacteriota bacterium]|nr:integrin alpha [Thermodesulfobacteriota bacterium]